MSILGKIKSIFYRKETRPLIYDEGLLQAYSSTSVCGGQLHGKTAVVTGSTSGIGYATAQRLLYEGCNVIITGRSEDKLKSAVLKLQEGECTLMYEIIDQLDVDSIQKGVANIFRNNTIDLWVNCAGIFKKTDRDRKFRGIESDTYFEVVNTNLKSTMLTTGLVADNLMNQSNRSVIINVASICGLTNHFGYTPYGISKTGVIEFTKDIADKYKEKVSILAIAPGSVATRMGTTGFGKNIAGSSSFNHHVSIPEETASEIVFLAGTVATYLKGQTILASAGEKV